jgi:hypothetical protein
LQAFLTALDTSLSRTWREEERSWRAEDRSWRAQDMDFRVEERDWWHLEHLWRQENRKWRVGGRRAARARERAVDLAEVRGEESPRRRGEERAAEEHLEPQRVSSPGSRWWRSWSSSSTTPRRARRTSSEVLIVAYAVTTATVVALMLNSMVLCSFLLCSILRNGKTYVSEAEEADYLFRCRAFLRQHYKPGDAPPTPKRSFEAFWETSLRGRLETRVPHVHVRRAGVLGEHRVRGVAQVPLLPRRRGRHHRRRRRRRQRAGPRRRTNWGWHVARGARAADRRAVSAERAARTRGHALRLARQAERAPGLRARRVPERRRRASGDGADAPSETEAGDVRADAAAVVVEPRRDATERAATRT